MVAGMHSSIPHYCYKFRIKRLLNHEKTKSAIRTSDIFRTTLLSTAPVVATLLGLGDVQEAAVVQAGLQPGHLPAQLLYVQARADL